MYLEKPPISMMIMPSLAARLLKAMLMDWMMSSHGEPVLLLAGRISPSPKTSVSTIMTMPAVKRIGWAGYFLSTYRATQTTTTIAISKPNI